MSLSDRSFSLACRQMLRFCLLPVVLFMLLTGCGDGAPDEYREIYRHSEDEAPSSLDPAQAATVYSNMVAVNVFDTL